MLEIEKKAHLLDPQNILEKLKSYNNIEYKGSFVKQDIYFTYKPVKVFEDILKQKNIFRVRYVDNQWYLTLKKKTLTEENVEVNQELEVLVNDKEEERIRLFFKELDLDPNKIDYQAIYTFVSAQDWIIFWESYHFYYLLSKEKTTELFILTKNGYTLSLEWNSIKDLGYFLELEGLGNIEEDIVFYTQWINTCMKEFGITKQQEEPRLYLELLYLKNYNL